MYGIGKIVGKLAGGLLEKVGLGKLAPIVSLGINALTGNWPGVAMDVAGLANRLTGGKLGFLNKIAQFAPIAKAFIGGGNVGDLFKAGGLNKLVGNLKNVVGNFKNVATTFKGAQQGFQALQSGDIFGGASKIFNAFKEVENFVKNKELFNTRSTSQNIDLLLGNINQQR